MSVIFSAASLAVVQPPCVLQSFVNHGAVLHKVFVVGDRHFCVERPSLKNFPSGPSGQSAPDLLVLLCLSFPFLSFPFLFLLFISFNFLSLSFLSCLVLFFSKLSFLFRLSSCPVLSRYNCLVLCYVTLSTQIVISLCPQTGRPSSSTATRCPSQSRALISRR